MNKLLLSCLGFCLLGFTAQAQWVTQPVPFASDVTSFYIDGIDANAAWVVGSGILSNSYVAPQVARTVDGGQTWTANTLPVQQADEEDFTAFSAVNSTTAWVTTSANSVTGGGRILRTTDGGQTWIPQGTGTVYGAPLSYPDMIHFFSTTEGITVGDALTQGAQMEAYATVDGGTTWTPLTLPVALTDETPLVTAPATYGNHIWFGTNKGRIFHSSDKGLTWTVATIPNSPEVSNVAFTDAQNGLSSAIDDSGGINHGLYRTSDGGATWSAVAYSGPLHGFGLSAVPGTGTFVSSGTDIGNGDQGSSYSRDNGQTWVAIENNLNHLSTEFVSPTVGWSAGLVVTPSKINSVVQRFSSTLLGTRSDAALQASLSVAPNPALGGRFTLQAARATGTAATVRVLDATGRLVQQHAWNPAAPLALDLAQAPAGLYVLEVQGSNGTARQKVVVQ